MPMFSVRETTLHHRGRLRNYSLPESQTERTFGLGSVEDSKGFTDRAPQGHWATTLLQSQRAVPSPMGEGAHPGPENPPVAADSCHWLVPWSPPWLRGDKQNLTCVHGRQGYGCWQIGPGRKDVAAIFQSQESDGI